MSTKLIKYWYTSLIDSDRISESEKILKDPARYVEGSCQSLSDGQMTELDSDKLQVLLEQPQKTRSESRSKRVEIKADEAALDNKILICPLLLVPQSSPSLKYSLAPLWMPAKVSLTGKLSCNGDILPWLSRQLLDYQDCERAIGKVEILDRFLDDRACPTTDWQDYWQFCNDLLEAVTGMTIADFTLPTYHVRSTVAILPNDLVLGTTASVKYIYEDILKLPKRVNPLLKRFTALTDVPPDPLLTGV